ncbi:MAG: hypothetical protein ACLR2O_06650 [Coprococcus sp.]
MAALTYRMWIAGKDDAVVVKAGDEEITAGVANFYARYTQAQYETYFASYFGGDDMWTKKCVRRQDL